MTTWVRTQLSGKSLRVEHFETVVFGPGVSGLRLARKGDLIGGTGRRHETSIVSFDCPSVLDAVEAIERVLANQDSGAVEEANVIFNYGYKGQCNWEFSKTELEGLFRVGAILGITCYDEGQPSLGSEV